MLLFSFLALNNSYFWAKLIAYMKSGIICIFLYLSLNLSTKLTYHQFHVSLSVNQVLQWIGSTLQSYWFLINFPEILQLLCFIRIMKVQCRNWKFMFLALVFSCKQKCILLRKRLNSSNKFSEFAHLQHNLRHKPHLNSFQYITRVSRFNCFSFSQISMD